MEKILEQLIDALGEKQDCAHEFVTKTFPMRKTWEPAKQAMLQERDELIALVGEIKKRLGKGLTLRSAFWAQVELDLECYDSHLRLNEKTNEIEEMAGKGK